MAVFNEKNNINVSIDAPRFQCCSVWVDAPQPIGAKLGGDGDAGEG